MAEVVTRSSFFAHSSRNSQKSTKETGNTSSSLTTSKDPPTKSTTFQRTTTRSKNGRKFRYDVVFFVQTDLLQHSRRLLVAHLQSPSVGLVVVKKRSTDLSSVFVLIGAREDRLDAQAEVVGLKMKLKVPFVALPSDFLGRVRRRVWRL